MITLKHSRYLVPLLYYEIVLHNLHCTIGLIKTHFTLLGLPVSLICKCSGSP